MENKNKEIVIKINNADANMLDTYSKKFGELMVSLDDKNEVQLSQLKYLCQDVAQLEKRINLKLYEKCPFESTMKVQINNEQYARVIRKAPHDEVVDHKNWISENIMKYIIDNKIDWRNELPIDYEALQEKQWYKDAISKGAVFYTTKSETIHKPEYHSIKIERLKNEK